MRHLSAFFLIFAATACKPDPTPAWAIDPMWIEPTETGMHGFQTWQLYRDKWEKNQRERTFVCAVLVELFGTESGCTDCQIAWNVTPEVVESDCDAKVQANETWTLLQRVSIGLEVTSDPTHPGLTSQGFVDYGWGWEVHGEAWPAALDEGRAASSGDWNGEQAFSFVPELAWPL